MMKTIGLFAHVDAGKTTFAEQLLYHTKSIRSRGRVDHKDSFMDNNSIEKERGITIFSDQAVFKFNSSTYFLVDTPGHADFSSEMERAIAVMDYAIIIVSAVEGVQAQTEVVWQLLKKHNVPAFFFINKTDREGADVTRTYNDIKFNITQEICMITGKMRNEAMEEELVETIAEKDEELLEKYLNGEYESKLWLSSMRKLIKSCELFPCCFGSALLDSGIEEFLETLDKLTQTDYNSSKAFSGIVYKIRHEGDVKLSYIKALSGRLKVKEDVGGEKINEIRIYNGKKFDNVKEIEAGELFAAVGLTSARTGDAIESGKLIKKLSYDMVPALSSRVIFDAALNPKEVLNYFRILEEEDPALNVLWEENLREIQVHIMGVIQLEILKEIVKERFGISVAFGPCEILYKESITSSVRGCGHFEPLKHYAEVHLKLEPGERNSGISFESECSLEDLSQNYQNLIRTHLFEREHHGVLTGSPITDIKITLLTGRSHLKHTSGGDFREAAFRSLRQGLEKAQNVLLEPFYRFKIKVSKEYMGRILSDIQKLSGTFEPPQMQMDSVTIKGRGPVSAFMNYAAELTAFTKGIGKVSFIFDGYDLCHNEKEVIEKLDYNKNADIEYTSTSIFCSKGQAFLVKGTEAEGYMHCTI